MPRGLPRTVGALIVGALLTGLALFWSDGSAYAPLVGIGGLAVVAAGAGLVLAFWPMLSLPRPDAAGLVFLGLFAALAVWIGLSIAWSVEPDRTWEYFNRSVVYGAFVVVGLLCAAAPRAVEWAAGGAALLFGAVILWALAGKVVPDLFPDGERISRLRDPLGYWNALAVIAAMAILLGAWLGSRVGLNRWLRMSGALLVFLSTVALLLTYSRGGVVVAAIVVGVFVALVREQLQAAATVAVGAIPGLAVSAWAFTQDGIAADNQSYDDRLSDGLQLGGAMVVGGALVVFGSLLLLRYEDARGDRLWRPHRKHWIAAGGVATACAVVAVLVTSGGDPRGWMRRGFEEFTTPTVGDASTAGRFGELSSNSRWDWWVESWDVFKEHPVVGSGAGTFDVARRPFRRNIIVVVEPHSLPLQFLAETGLVGLVLLLGMLAAGVAACVAGVRRTTGAERAAATALALAGAAYILHALVDYDWDFLALSGPALLVVGLLIGVGRPPIRAARRMVLAGAAGLCALALLYSVAAPWLATRKVESAYAALEEGDLETAARSAEDARALNPFSLDPLRVSAAVFDQAGNRQRALERLARAVELQPQNWVAWYELARYEEDNGLTDAAIRHALEAQRLDPRNPRLGPMLERLFGSQ
jgi:O-antigen ligase/Flp pilus assembly protein TadD